MKRTQYIIIFYILTGFYFSACIKSTIVGDEILNKDEIGVEFTDTVFLKAKTEKNDSLRVYPTLSRSFLLGRMNNTITGKSNADLFVDFQTLNTPPDTDVIKFDSIVLTVIIDTSLLFGDRHESYNLEIFELNENIIKTETDTFYSDQTFDYLPNSIAVAKFTPSVIDTLTVIEPGNDTAKYAQQLRIKLPDQMGMNFLSDYENIKNDTLFKALFKGIYLKTNSVDNSMVGVSFSDAKGEKATKIEVYYTVDSSLQKIIFPVHHIISHFEQDPTGSEIETAFDNEELGKEYLYIQGMVGSKLEVEIPDFEFLKEYNLNKASLILYTVENEEDNKDLPSRLIAYTQDSTGTKEFIDDFKYSLDSQDPYFYFGYGTETTENDIKTTKYVLNLTLFLRKLINEKTYNTKFFIAPENRINNPGFAKFYGHENDILKSKLNIVYSNTN